MLQLYLQVITSSFPLLSRCANYFLVLIMKVFSINSSKDRPAKEYFLISFPSANKLTVKAFFNEQKKILHQQLNFQL